MYIHQGVAVCWLSLDFSIFLSRFSFVVCSTTESEKPLDSSDELIFKWLLIISPKFKIFNWFTLFENWFFRFGWAEGSNLLNHKNWLIEKLICIEEMPSGCNYSLVHSVSFLSLVLSLTHSEQEYVQLATVENAHPLYYIV